MLDGVSISERRACRLVGLSRTSYREPPSAHAQTTMLSARIIELAYERQRFGDFSRECVDIAVDHGVSGEYVTRLLEPAGQFRGFPDAVRTLIAPMQH